SAGRRGGRGRGGRGGRGNRRGNRAPSGETVSWTRTLSDGVTVQESAFIASENNVIIFQSNENASDSVGFQPSEVYYGFEGNEPIMAIATRGRRRSKPCFLATPQQSYDDLVTELRERNGTTVSANTTLDLNVQAGPMNGTIARAISRQHPFIRRVCIRNKYYDSRGTADSVDGQETSLIKTLAIDTEVEITVPVISRDERRNRGNRGGRGNRRGGNRRGGRRGERPARVERINRRGRGQGRGQRRRNGNRGAAPDTEE
ncbi:hypothetical protein EGW08_019850, partial [Elysia chlorotica]